MDGHSSDEMGTMDRFNATYTDEPITLESDEEVAQDPPFSQTPNSQPSSSVGGTRGRERSQVWPHVTKFEKIHPKLKVMYPYARCNTCRMEFPAHTTKNGTTRIAKHLKFGCMKCPIYVGVTASSTTPGMVQTELTQQSMGAPLVPHVFSQKACEEALYEWIIRDEQPFRAVQGKGFMKLLKVLCPKFKVPNRKYLSQPFEKMNNKSFDLLAWWKCNQVWFPVLSKLARDLFSIPSSTVASENAFSLGGRIVDSFRASLTPRTVEALVCASDWMRAEEITFYKEEVDEEVELYEELEDIEIRLGCSQIGL